MHVYRTSLVDRDGYFIDDAVTPRSPAYDERRRATAGRWFTSDRQLDRYWAYRAAVIMERRLRATPAATAAVASRNATKALLAVLRDPKSLAVGGLEEAERWIADVTASGYPTLLSVGSMRALVNAVADGTIGRSAAEQRIQYLGRRSGSGCNWFFSVEELDVAELTDPVDARLGLALSDLARPGAFKRLDHLGAVHGLPNGQLERTWCSTSDPTSGPQSQVQNEQRRAVVALRGLIEATVPDCPPLPTLYALELELDLVTGLAASSLLSRQPPEIRALAPDQDQSREYLLPRSVAVHARIVRSHRLAPLGHSTVRSIPLRKLRASPTDEMGVHGSASDRAKWFRAASPRW